jgi:hypothetical protein
VIKSYCVEIFQGIPEDTPENSVRAITGILHDEAKRLEAEFNIEKEENAPQISITIDISKSGHSLTIFLRYVTSDRLEEAFGSIGIGFIGEKWSLRLFPKDEFHQDISAPFRWGVYASGKARPGADPIQILDGQFLRSQLSEQLHFRPAP